MQLLLPASTFRHSPAAALKPLMVHPAVPPGADLDPLISAFQQIFRHHETARLVVQGNIGDRSSPLLRLPVGIDGNHRLPGQPVYFSQFSG